jgi:hypothetical protein
MELVGAWRLLYHIGQVLIAKSAKIDGLFPSLMAGVDNMGVDRSPTTNLTKVATWKA